MRLVTSKKKSTEIEVNKSVGLILDLIKLNKQTSINFDYTIKIVIGKDNSAFMYAAMY